MLDTRAAHGRRPTRILGYGTWADVVRGGFLHCGGDWCGEHRDPTFSGVMTRSAWRAVMCWLGWHAHIRRFAFDGRDEWGRCTWCGREGLLGGGKGELR
jgi:hypothetical protein